MASLPASADLFFYSYIKKDSTATQKEPINVLFTIGGTLSASNDHIWHHLSWSDAICSGTQYFQDHGVWQAQQGTRASGGWCDAVRYHIRLNQQDDDGGAGYGTFTMGPVHYEDRPGGCYDLNHRVVSFNLARDEVNNKFTTWHTAEWVYWGNTDPYTQCDGTSRQSDGWIARLVTP